MARRLKNIVGALVGATASLVAPVQSTEAPLPPVATAPSAKRRRKQSPVEVEITDERRLTELSQTYEEVRKLLPGVPVSGRRYSKGALPAKVNAKQFLRLGQRYMIEFMGVKCVDVNGNVIAPPKVVPAAQKSIMVDGKRYITSPETDIELHARHERQKQKAIDDLAERGTSINKEQIVKFLPKQYP